MCICVDEWMSVRGEGGLAYREWIFIDGAASSGYNVGRVECPEHGGCLACVNDEQQLIISKKKRKKKNHTHTSFMINPVCTIIIIVLLPPFLPHLFKGISQLVVWYLLRVLKLEEPIATMACHVDKNIAPIITQETLGARNWWIKSTSQHTKKILNSNL